MRPVERGPNPKDDNGHPVQYTEYSRARRDLIDQLGEYCSYCEVRLASSLAVEHIEPKTLNPQLELVWSNFLLACTNCNSTKGKKSITLADYVWPHLHNTSLYFDYLETGHIKTMPGLDNNITTRAENMIDLVGLDKVTPKEGTVAYNEASDRRFENRYEMFIEAKVIKKELDDAEDTAKPHIINHIVSLAKFRGFWSVWMTVFHDRKTIRSRLINEITGTCTTCFDANTTPVNRP